MSTELTFENQFIKENYIIEIPAYQRAYAWGEKEVENFINDLLEIKEKKYYYGHYILEQNEKESKFEIIDGQQRITTFVLFILASKLYLNNEIEQFSDFIKNRFKTIEYDRERFNELLISILEENKIVEKHENDTSSFIRILDSLEFFKKIFKKNEIVDTSLLINSLLNAEISIHKTKDKQVAVQIFELQNSRGIKLDLIEKVKALLMKEIYLNSPNQTNNIQSLQEDFTAIYKLEESTTNNSFKGDLSLSNILFHHLRVVDDGKFDKSYDKLSKPFNNNEDAIINYIKDQLKEKSDIVQYILSFSKSFRKSVEFINTNLLTLDNNNPLVGDCIILDRQHSVELYLILFHLDKISELSSDNLVLWERFLLTRDFHHKYYNLKGKRDNFQGLFSRVINKNSIETFNFILNDFLEHGFRGHGKYKLLEAVSNDVNNAKLLFNAFYTPWKHKIIFVLYKYEISIDNKIAREKLRTLFKTPISVEHILPQTYDVEWLSDKENKEQTKLINGLGNLILLSTSENSQKGNDHPKDKVYNFDFGSYQEHNTNRQEWENSNNWENLIKERGQKIYDFMFDYFKINKN